MWVIQQWPDLYVARKVLGDARRPEREICHRDLDRLRELFIQAGYNPEPRHDDDADYVVEWWTS
jgi:hypothetical protein